MVHGRLSGVAVEIVGAEGHRIDTLINAAVDRDPAGGVSSVQYAVFDATERRQYETELLAAKRRAEASEAHALVLAKTLQQTLIPPAVPAIDGLELAAVYRPAGAGEEVGGDFYDVFQVATDDWVVIVGDVCGKGVDAAIVTATARHVVRAAAVMATSTAQILDALNTVLLASDTDRFCTVSLLRLRRIGGAWTVRFSTGGHPLPLLVRGDFPLREVGALGKLVGATRSAVFIEHQVEVLPGDTLVLYTDGTTEGRRGRDWFGDEGLHQSINAHRGSAAQLVDGLLSDVLEFQDGHSSDDIVIVAITFRRRSPRRLLRPGDLATELAVRGLPVRRALLVVGELDRPLPPLVIGRVTPRGQHPDLATGQEDRHPDVLARSARPRIVVAHRRPTRPRSIGE